MDLFGDKNNRNVKGVPHEQEKYCEPALGS